jgi:phosphatidylinositol alpha 1,6-mannosyltransferase
MRLPTKPLRVALFTDTYAPQVNGVARTLWRLVNHLEDSGHEVFLVTPRVADVAGAPPSVGSGPARVYHRTRPGLPLPPYPELQITGGMGPRIRSELEAFCPDVVHCATESMLGWSGRRWALDAGVPFLTSFHTNFPTYAASYGLGFAEPSIWALLRRFHRPARQTLCPSQGTMALLGQKGFHPRLALWSRGVDALQFHPARRTTSMRQRLGPEADLILLYVGRLAPEKRLELLLEAYPSVRDDAAQRSVRVGLALVGSGPMQAELERRAIPGVVLTGPLSGQPLAEAYASGDVFAFPSDTETFGNVVLEAMASGLPVVGVDGGGVRELIDPDVNGVRTPPGQVAPYAAALSALVHDSERRHRLGAGARVSAERRSWNEILDGVIAHYARAASPNAPLEAYA